MSELPVPETPAPPAPAPERAGRREWAGLAVLALPSLLIALDIGVLFLALPALSADLGATATEQLWITDVYGFLLAGLLVPMGVLGDRIGRRKLLLAGAAALRAGLGAGRVRPEPGAADRRPGAARRRRRHARPVHPGADQHPVPGDGRQRGTAIAVWGTWQFAGSALGPVLGGVLLACFWWGSAFLLGVPVMALLLVAGPVLLPETPRGSARVDGPSVALALAALLPAVWGVKELALGGSRLALPVLAAGLAAGWVFVRRQAALDAPLVDLALLRDRRVGSLLLAMAAASAALAGSGLMTSQYVQTVVGLAPAAAGLWQAPTGLGIAAGVLLAPLLARSGPRAMLGGLGVSAVGLVVLATVHRPDALALVAFAVAGVAFGVGPLFALGTGTVVGSVPVERAGAAASLSETSNLLGSTLGLALLGSLGAAVYRHGAPAGSQTVADAAGLRPDLLATAHDAYARGLTVVAAAGVLLVAVVALLVRRAAGTGGGQSRVR